MKGSSIFRRVSILIFILITVLSLLFIAISYLSITHFYRASTQRLNKDVAAHIAEFTSPFEKRGLNKKKADSVFYNAMVISPSIEVYFLDTTGKIIYYQAPDSSILLWQIPLSNIKKYIASRGEKYLTNADPKNPSSNKIFSAAEVSGTKKLGYIYVILGSKEYGNVTEMLFRSHVTRLAIRAFLVIVALSFAISLYNIHRLKKNYQKIIGVLEKYEQGSFDERFRNTRNEFAPITNSFNKMADRLSGSMEQLRRSEKERKDFIASISHDLRTPLSIARGYTETLISELERNNDKETQLEYTRLVHKKIEQVQEMTNQLSELSKIDWLETAPNKEPFIFSEILEELAKTFKLKADEKNIQFDCEGCQDMSWINADIRMMERVVQNLLNNAVKYTPEKGSIKIAVSRKNDELACSIENTGTLIPAEIIQWINDNKKTNSRPKKSSGLGLAIVKKYLHLHKYPFEISSHANKNRLLFIMQIYHSERS